VERTRSRFVDFRYELALACVACGAGQHQDAARIAGFADALRKKLDANFWFKNVFDELRTALMGVMPAGEMSHLWAEGMTMTVEEAFRRAIGQG